MDRDDGGSGNVDAAVDDRDAARSGHAVTHPAVRMSRAQLRDVQHPQSRSRGGQVTFRQLPIPNYQLPTTPNSQFPTSPLRRSGAWLLGVGRWAWLGIGSWRLGVSVKSTP